MEKTEVFLQPMQNIIPTLSGISQNAVEYLASLEWEKGRKKHERQGLVTLMGHLWSGSCQSASHLAFLTHLLNQMELKAILLKWKNDRKSSCPSPHFYQKNFNIE